MKLNIEDLGEEVDRSLLQDLINIRGYMQE